MLKSLKEKIKSNFPALVSIYRNYRQKRSELNKYKSFAQIESEISRSYLKFYGRKLNWETPRAFTEKITVAKVYGASQIKTRLADKYLVREWVASKVGEKYLVPLLGVYDSFDEIDFDSLPEKFVMKCNHDCGSVKICDKSNLDIRALRKHYQFYLKRNFAWLAYELHYNNIKPKIIIEKYVDYMERSGIDYKFFCFSGKPYFCRILTADHRMNFYDMDWKLQPFTWEEFGFYDSGEMPRPEHFEEMKELSVELSKNFDQVRVDLYLAGEKIYFGEMTFTTMGGYGKCTPDEWDFKLGDLWEFDNTLRSKILSSFKSPLEYLASYHE